jgi:hypothetical protein
MVFRYPSIQISILKYIHFDLEAASFELQASISKRLQYQSLFGSFNIEVCIHNIGGLDLDIEEISISKYFDIKVIL